MNQSLLLTSFLAMAASFRSAANEDRASPFLSRNTVRAIFSTPWLRGASVNL